MSVLNHNNVMSLHDILPPYDVIFEMQSGSQGIFYDRVLAVRQLTPKRRMFALHGAGSSSLNNPKSYVRIGFIDMTDTGPLLSYSDELRIPNHKGELDDISLSISRDGRHVAVGDGSASVLDQICAGRVYVYECYAEGKYRMSEELTVMDCGMPPQMSEHFGTSVCFDDTTDRLAVHARRCGWGRGEDVRCSRVFIFEAWSTQEFLTVGAPAKEETYVYRFWQVLDDKDAEHQTAFGRHIVFQSNALYIGAPEWCPAGRDAVTDEPNLAPIEDQPYHGRVFVYRWDMETEQFVYSQTIENPKPVGYDRFGYSFCLDAEGLRLAIAAPVNSDIGHMSGQVYLFRRETLESRWEYVGQSGNPDPTAFDWFGVSLAWTDENNTLLVSARREGVAGIDTVPVVYTYYVHPV